MLSRRTKGNLMSEEQLYALAQKRVDRRNRRWLLWGVNFLGLMGWIAFAAAFGERMLDGFGPMVAIIWTGVVVLHGVYLGMAQTRDYAVEREVAHLRRDLYGDKPKRQHERLHLSEDGELIDDDSGDAYFTDDKAHRNSV
jgi:hypothetical protein